MVFFSFQPTSTCQIQKFPSQVIRRKRTLFGLNVLSSFLCTLILHPSFLLIQSICSSSFLFPAKPTDLSFFFFFNSFHHLLTSSWKDGLNTIENGWGWDSIQYRVIYIYFVLNIPLVHDSVSFIYVQRDLIYYLRCLFYI